MSRLGPTIVVDPGSSVWDFPDFGRQVTGIAGEFQGHSPETISVRFKAGAPAPNGFVSAEIGVANERCATLIRTIESVSINGWGMNLKSRVELESDLVGPMLWDRERVRMLLARCIAARLTGQWKEERNELDAKDRAVRVFNKIGFTR